MKANVIIHRDFTVAPVDPRIYGLHLVGADHAAIADPSHYSADDTGLRTDVMDLVRAFRLPCMLGTTALRPLQAESRSRPDNAIRVDGLVDWCRQSGAEPMLSLPLHDLADHRIGLGERHGVRMWHLGCLDDDAPAERFDELASRLRASDPSSTLVLGSAPADRALQMLDRHHQSLDLVSLPVDEDNSVSSASLRLERSIQSLADRLDRSRIVDRCGRAVGMQVDLWGSDTSDALADDDAALERALTMNVLIRRADRVRTAFAGNVLAGLAELVSERIGMGHRPDHFDPVLVGSIYGRGVSLMPVVRSGVEDADGNPVGIDVSAVHDEDQRTLTLFVANRGAEPMMLDADLHGFAAFAIGEHRLAAPGPRMPGARSAAPKIERSRLEWVLPARSYGMVRLTKRPD